MAWHIHLTAEPPVRIAFLGDSLTEGAPGASYIRLLRRQLADDDLLNLGRAGDSVADLYARLQHTGLEPVDLAVVWIGTNDAALGDWAPWACSAFEPVTWEATLEHIAAVYRRLLGWVAARAAAVICVPPVVADELDGEWAQRVADVGGVVQEAASANPRTTFLDVAPWFAETREHLGAGGFTIDGIHLSPAGAEVVAAAFATAIEVRRPAPPP